MRAAMLAVLGIVGLTACSVTPASEQGKAETTEAITTTSNTFVTLTVDARRCIAPICGGYYIQDVNKTTTARYVSGLDFSASGLDSATIGKITSAPVAEIVLRGHLSAADPSFGTQQLVVTEAYRGMPGSVVQATDNFFQVNASTTNVTELNVQVLGPYVSTDVDGAAAPFTDKSVLQRQIGSYSAIVAGDATLDWDWSTTMTAHQVFYKLPFHHGPCPMYMVQNCAPQMNTYTRNADMCMLGGACVTQGICPLFRPGCQNGYTLHSWATAPNGCSQYVCDPSFLN